MLFRFWAHTAEYSVKSHDGAVFWAGMGVRSLKNKWNYLLWFCTLKQICALYWSYLYTPKVTSLSYILLVTVVVLETSSINKIKDKNFYKHNFQMLFYDSCCYRKLSTPLLTIQKSTFHCILDVCTSCDTSSITRWQYFYICVLFAFSISFIYT